MTGFVQQLLHYNSGCTRVPLSPPPVILDRPGTASVGMPSSDFFFYSNNPEEIGAPPPGPWLADNGFWLLKEYVFGAGQVFMWHQNTTGSSINEALVINNPNTFDILVTSFGAGVRPPGDGVDVWYSYFQGGGPSPLTIPPGQFGNLFMPPGGIAPNAIYGVVAIIKITNVSQTTSANAFLYDLAWVSNSGGATMQAPAVGPQLRGLGNGYYIFVDLNTMYVMDALTAPQGFTIASTTDSFHGDDVPRVTDPGGGPSAPLQGCYGARYYNMSWKVSNNDSQPRTVTIYAGNGNVPDTNFAIKTSYTTVDGGFGGCSQPPEFQLLPGDYLALLQDTLAPDGSIHSFGFTLVTIGGRNYPLTLAMGAA